MAAGNVSIINWEKINARLPWARTPEAKRQRRRMWEAIDVNDNGFVSLAEVTRVRFAPSLSFLTIRIENPFKGVRDVINVTELFECRPAINAAFHQCKALSKVNSLLYLQAYKPIILTRFYVLYRPRKIRTMPIWNSENLECF